MRQKTLTTYHIANRFPAKPGAIRGPNTIAVRTKRLILAEELGLEVRLIVLRHPSLSSLSYPLTQTTPITIVEGPNEFSKLAQKANTALGEFSLLDR